MRVAVLCDVHGNAVALDAVVADAQDERVDHFWCLGDLVAHGPRPVDVVDRLRGLPELICVRGNTDRYVLTGDLSGMLPPIDDPRTPEQFAVLAGARESFGWTRDRLVEAGQREWLAGLPVEEHLVLPDGARVLLVHASPGRDDGPGLQPDLSHDALVDAGFGAGDADLILVGHTHVADERHVAGSHAVNPGPVSLPRNPDDRARWLLLNATPDRYNLEHRTVHYDLDRVIADLAQQRHPSHRWLATKMTPAI